MSLVTFQTRKQFYYKCKFQSHSVAHRDILDHRVIPECQDNTETLGETAEPETPGTVTLPSATTPPTKLPVVRRQIC